jgi:hypothetical protein
MQTADRKPMVNGVFSQAHINQLPPRNHTVLPLSQPGDTRVDPLSTPRLGASTSQPAYIAG